MNIVTLKKDRLAMVIIEKLGLDPMRVRGIKINMAPGAPTEIQVQCRIPDDELEELAEVIQVHKIY